MPNKHVQNIRDRFEQLRKQELQGKIQPYNKLFLSNKFLKNVYQENIKESQKVVKNF